MTDVIQHIEAALERGNSKHTVAEVWHWLCTGQASLAIGTLMTGSWRVTDDGVGEIVHVGGQWNAEDARWLIDRMEADLLSRGVTNWKWSGRKGWARFLKLKEFTP